MENSHSLSAVTIQVLTRNKVLLQSCMAKGYLLEPGETQSQTRRKPTSQAKSLKPGACSGGFSAALMPQVLPFFTAFQLHHLFLCETSPGAENRRTSRRGLNLTYTLRMWMVGETRGASGSLKRKCREDQQGDTRRPMLTEVGDDGRRPAGPRHAPSGRCHPRAVPGWHHRARASPWI